jgi:hypothetical protein
LSALVPHTGIGTLLVGAPTELRLAGAAAAAPAALVFGYSSASVPLLGGTLLPALDIVVPFVTNGVGDWVESFPWPAAVPGNVHYYSQYLVLDASAAQGVAFSNALQWTTRP